MFDGDLHKLVEKGDVKGVCKWLSKSSAKVDKTDRDGQTALHRCAERGYVEICRHLLKAGAFPDVEDNRGRTPLFVAVQANKFNISTVLCEAGASTGRADVDKRTPLHVAARDGLVECAKVLLLHGAPIDNNPDKWGTTPEKSCITSDIRLFIGEARRKRAAAACAADGPSAPPAFTRQYKSSGDKYGGSFDYVGKERTGSEAMAHNSHFNPAFTPPSYQEALCLSEQASPHVGSGKVLSPMSRAREAAKLGGDRCSGCCASERSRQLTPCYHVVCNSCANHCKTEGDNRCPACGGQVFDDNLWIP